MTKNIYCQHLVCDTKLLPSQSKFCSLSCSTKEKNRLATNKKISSYALEPNHCIQCNKALDYTHRKNKFCSITCSELSMKKRFKQKFNQGLLTERSAIKRYIVERDTYKCESCSISEWQNKPISLHLDHIDGNPSNNMPENFRLLCPNCHSQTPSYGAKNKGSGRKTRGLPTR